jgi:CheY-like chemotaxis protein
MKQRKTSILVVAYNNNDQFTIKKILEQENYSVTIADNNKDAYYLLEKTEFDLIMLDVNIPVLNKYEFMDIILQQYYNIPLIISIHERELGFIDAAFKKGIAGYVLRPYKKDEMLLSISTAIENRRVTAEKSTINEIVKRSSYNLIWFDKYLARAKNSLRKKKTILIIDNNVADVLLLEYVLEETNFRVLTAYDSDRGMEMALKELPNLILLDLILPWKTGLVVLENLKKNKNTSEIPVILLGGTYDARDINTATEIGIEAFVEKPCYHKKMLNVIENVLQNKSEGVVIYTN